MQTLNFVGCGRVGRTIGRLWQTQRCFAVQDVVTASLPSAVEACHAMGVGTARESLAEMRSADVWFLAVPDQYISSASQALADSRRDGHPAIALHGSGALSSGSLSPLRALGWHTASVHCILSFSSVASALEQFPGTACALEGDDQALEVLRPAMQAIGAHCFDLAAADKVLYHAAAVFATNFIPVLQHVAESTWEAVGVPQPIIGQLRSQLLRHAAENIIRQGPAGALTGPAARGDVGAITRQSAVLRGWNAATADAYDALSTLALGMAKELRPDQPLQS